MKPQSKVFIDSSVLFTAAVSLHGSAQDLLLVGFAGACDLYFSMYVLLETERNLRDKAPQAQEAFYQFRSQITHYTEPSPSLIKEAARIVILKDAPIVVAAVSVHADYLATYDRKHLLAKKEDIKAHFDLIVVTPGELLQSD